MLKKDPARRRYTSELLIYEAFYVSLRNALFVGLGPLFVFLFLAAVEDFRMTDGFLSTIITITEITFVIAFFINFLYYVYFIKLRKVISFLLTLVASIAITGAIFFSDLKDTLPDTHQAIILTSWFLLLAVIMIVNKIGNWPNKESGYETESWLYRHALADAPPEKEDKSEPEDRYMHRYVERPTPNDPAHDDEDKDRLP